MTEGDPGYPLLLRLAGRTVVVVGGGAVAVRRVEGLLAAGARVVVVAPEPDPRLEREAVEVRRRQFVDGDLDEAALVHACAGPAEVNQGVSRAARARRVLCVRADDREASDAWVPAVLRRGEIVVAVSAGGAPARARHLRDRLAAALDGAAPDGVGPEGAGPVQPPPGWDAVPAPVGAADDMTVAQARLLARADVVVLDRTRHREALVHAAVDVRADDSTGLSATVVAERVRSWVASGHRVVVVRDAVDDLDELLRD